MISKTRKPFPTPWAAALALVLSFAFSAANALTVPATANIYGACQSGTCGGTAAPTQTVSAGTSYSITATGSVQYGSSIPANGPDGIAVAPASTQPFQAFNNRTGPAVSNGSDVQRRFLAGVFLGPSDPVAAPAAFSQTVNATTIAPTALGQIFFIGDGKTNLNVSQLFVAPAGATRLLLGFIDRCSDFSIGCFSDNTGSLTVTLTAVPLPAAAWLFLSALGGLVLVGRRRRMHGTTA